MKTWKTREDAFIRAHGPEMTAQELADHFGVTLSSIRNRLSHNKVKAKQVRFGGREIGETVHSQAKINQACRLRRKGMQGKEIARITGISLSRVYFYTKGCKPQKLPTKALPPVTKGKKSEPASLEDRIRAGMGKLQQDIAAARAAADKAARMAA